MNKNDIYDMLQAYEGAELDKKELIAQNRKLKRKTRRQKIIIILLSIKLIAGFLVTAVQNGWINVDTQKMSNDVEEFQKEVENEKVGLVNF